MADYTLTPANVVVATSNLQFGTAGEDIDAGEFLAVNATDKKVYLADANVAALRNVVGIAVSSSAAGQPATYTKKGTVTVQAAAFAGKGIPLVLSATPGKVRPADELATGDELVFCGYTTDTNQFELMIARTEVVK